MDAKARDSKYDFIRGILTLFVVIGHASIYRVGTDFGGIYYSDIMKSMNVDDTNFHILFLELSTIIYSFHMPAFFALSGALYEKSSKQYSSFWDLIINKSKRLLLPFFVVWIVWNIPIKYVTEYYNCIDSYKIFLQILVPFNVYLWYLICLYLVFVLIYIIESKLNGHKCAIFCGIIVSFFIGIIYQRMGSTMVVLGNPLKYMIWFYMGQLLNKGFLVLKNKKQALIAICCFAFTYIISRNISHLGWLLRDSICPALGILLLWYFADKIDCHCNSHIISKFKRIIPYCFGIYLYGDPINYIVLYCIYYFYGIGVFGSEIVAVLMAIARIVGSIVIPVLIVKILQKAPICKYLY